MVIDKVHGLQTTGMTLDQRFTMLATVAPDRVITPKRQPRQTVGSFLNQSLNFKNRNLIQEIARQLEYQAQKQALRDRIGARQQHGQGLRRFGSESSLVGLRRSNSFGNLTQQNVKSRLSWRQSNGNLSNRSRSVSVSSAPGGRGFGFRRRGGQRRVVRGRFGNSRNNVQLGQFGRISHVQRRGARRGTQRGGQRGRGAPRGGNRGGVIRSQTPKPIPTREQLDAQLDQYMAGTKAALDKELDEYMKDAMDLDVVVST